MVESGYAAALKAEASISVATGATAAIWGDRGRSAAILTPFAEETGAQAQGARLMQFEGAPLALDRPIVPGRRRDLDRRCIRLRSRELGYSAGGELVFVIGVEELDNDTTRLAVLRRLA